MKEILKSWWFPALIGLIFIFGAFSLHDIALWSIKKYFADINHPSQFNSSITGTIGDTMGGTTGPYIAIAAVFLTFIAFWAQILANKEIQNQFRIQQFESQYFEMIRLHKENINEMKISGYSYLMSTSFIEGKAADTTTISRTQIERVVDGRKVFVSMVKELNACFEFCRSYAVKYKVPEKNLYEIAYKFFFFGSFSQLVSDDNNKTFINVCRKRLKDVRKEHKDTFGGKKDFLVGGKKIDLHIKYAPFTGHESRLAHYYRHLFSAVKMVVKKEHDGLFDYKQSREYLKILRAQMSNDEQILLYHNYISGMGGDWEKESNLFLSKYRMLHNLPIDKVRFVEPPRKHFLAKISEIKRISGDDDPMFEWGDED